jgi:hypothetical protein
MDPFGVSGVSEDRRGRTLVHDPSEKSLVPVELGRRGGDGKLTRPSGPFAGRLLKTNVELAAPGLPLRSRAPGAKNAVTGPAVRPYHSWSCWPRRRSGL